MNLPSFASNRALFVAAFVMALTPGCQPTGVSLVIVASSDLTPYEEVDSIQVELVGVGLSETTSVDERTRLDQGIEVWNRSHANLDGRHVRVTFLRAGEVVATRDLVFDHQVDRTLDVLIPRECTELDCGRLETCVLGVCAPDTCVDGTEADCPAPTCTSSEDCVVTAACAEAECRGGACLLFGDDGACDGTLWCDPDEGCVESRGAMRDGGAGDGGVGDAGLSDAGVTDAGVTDAGLADGGATGADAAEGDDAGI